jgi:hypothetical protein
LWCWANDAGPSPFEPFMPEAAALMAALRGVRDDGS